MFFINQSIELNYFSGFCHSNSVGGEAIKNNIERTSSILPDDIFLNFSI